MQIALRSLLWWPSQITFTDYCYISGHRQPQQHSPAEMVAHRTEHYIHAIYSVWWSMIAAMIISNRSHRP